MKSDLKFGAYILQSLTTGMYDDSKVIYREYIQNACDSIDQAISNKTLSASMGEINIWIDANDRNVSIVDNGTGIRASEFTATLGNTGDSNKSIEKNKGFRGIGRLCGLAYCKELIFTSTYKQENIVSILKCDAEKMRLLLSEHTTGKKHSADDILQAIYSFDSYVANDLVKEHFFKVELKNINIENQDLLDKDKISEFLSFILPVPYQNQFTLRNKIYSHIKKMGFHVDEYSIKLDGIQIYKKYTKYLKDGVTKYDEVFDIEFKDFYDKDERLIAWMWYGLSKFSRVIPKCNQMIGLRLRKHNIQIGDENTITKKKMFKQKTSNDYFIGEIFAVSNELIPTSQRDYFEENSTRLLFEEQLTSFFEFLYSLYYAGSTINSAHKKINTYKKQSDEFTSKEKNKKFVNKDEKENEFEKLKKTKDEADKRLKQIQTLRNKGNDTINKIIDRVQKENDESIDDLPNQKKWSSEKQTNRVDKLSKLPRESRKLVSKIWGIILENVDKQTAELLISKIEDELK